MIELNAVAKRFSVPKAKKKQKVATDVDPREQGRWFNAVSDISFQAKSGRILGLLGPNGAGKTTILRMLSTAIKPTSGSILIDDVDVVDNPVEVRRRIGFLTGNTGLYGRLSVREMVAYFGNLYGLSGDALKQRMEDLFETLDMKSFTEKRCDALSFGMKQKTNIARTLIHNPDIIVLDEPTTGLDVSASETILQLIETCRAQEKTVLFSTHHMHEVDRLCDEVVIISQGEVCFRGDVPDMRSRSGHDHLDKAFLALIENKEAQHV